MQLYWGDVIEVLTPGFGMGPWCSSATFKVGGGTPEKLFQVLWWQLECWGKFNEPFAFCPNQDVCVSRSVLRSCYDLI